ncbi:hypothetical protein [Acinetobacter bohemicus]|uniref:hypothetical protein n=1 Tax=Acinetobacter bohemicus TaxID=1435036 RepID=UPI00192AD184|nr:hypothetical protein [Acinetobacter bohemicus]CAD9197504.1 hypothetical protein QAC21B_03678 [Acinetobacter bohemicus]
MADQPITREKLINADKDVQVIEDFIKKPKNETVTTRFGDQIMTLKGLEDEVKKSGGYFKRYTSLAAANADIANIPVNGVVKVTNAVDGGDYERATSGATTLTKSPYDPVQLSKLNAASLSLIANYLTESAKRDFAILSETSNKYLAVKAVKKIAITNPTAGEQYKIYGVLKNTASGSRISIASSVGVISEISIAASTIVSGVQEYTLAGLKNGKVVINWDTLADGFSLVGINLDINNDVYLSELNTQTSISTAQTTANNAQTTAGNANTTALSAATTAANSLNLAAANKPDWMVAEDTLSSATTAEKKLAYAIKGVEIYGTHAYEFFRVIVFAKNDATYGNRIFIANPAGSTVLSFNESAQLRKGIQTHNLSVSGGSGLTGKITIDWDLVSEGLALNNTNSTLKINPNCKNLAYARQVADENAASVAALQNTINSLADSSKLATKAYRVAVAGSSITWGGGYLGEESYVGTVEQMLRTQLAKTIHAKDISAGATTLTGSDFYLGSAKRISGLNTEVSFSLDGDELSLSVARERENAGACLVELYVDNVLYDTFDTYTKPSVSRTQNFTGNGADIKFDLDGCFTYDHVVTVAGVAKTGKLNTQKDGASIPSSDDYMIIRRYDSVNNRVVHTLWFKTAPTGAIVVNYKQGENIRHLKGTIDRSGAGLTTILESAYGDGSVSYDTTVPSAVSSGFGFRESDVRSVKTWKFSDSKTRAYKLKIKALHTSATGATPYLDLNFVTNRMHHLMNAGIGGWTAASFINHALKINMIDKVIDFNPDIVLIESCTNDDWTTGVFKAYVSKTGLTAAQILAEPTANYFKAISGTSSNKTVQDVRLQMTAIDAISITLASNTVDTDIAVGDIIFLGDYGGSHKRMAIRTVKAYDSVSKKITLNRAISTANFAQVDSLSDLLSEHVMIMNAPTWATQIKTLCDSIWSALPDCKISLATAGVPHFYIRKIFGYRELAQKVAKEYGLGFVDFYNASLDFQYTQKLSTHQTVTSTGASSYDLTASGYVLPNAKVFIDGVEHKKCRITGGLSHHWLDSVTDPTLSNISNYTRPYKLIFDANVPASGATIVVQKSATAWANDYCHPTGPQGFFVLGQSASKILKDVV